jgi:Putative translation factor (SUA5)
MSPGVNAGVNDPTVWDCGRSPATSDASREKVVAQAVSIMRGGGVVVLPTENCYVLAADAFSLKGTGRLRRAKVQDTGKPLGLLVGSPNTVAWLATCATHADYEISHGSVFACAHRDLAPRPDWSSSTHLPLVSCRSQGCRQE